jgi:hypothetical protein
MRANRAGVGKMRICVLFLLLASGQPALASQIRIEVGRSSGLERELGYSLSVLDKNDASRAEGVGKASAINVPAPEYMVRFRAAIAGRLTDLFGMGLALADADGILVEAPLEIKLPFDRENHVTVEFLIRKSLIGRATLTLRCGSPLSERSYGIRLKDYVGVGINP